MNKIHIVFGPQGAGKSTYSGRLSKEVKGVHFSIDDWMWKLYGEDLPSSMDFNWIMERVERCEEQIWATAEKVAACGVDVVLDLGFTKVLKRSKFESLAAEKEISSQLHYVDALHATRRKRVMDRNVERGDTFVFEVSPGMFDFMEREFQKPSAEELRRLILVDTNL